ncbi:hypothetical protein PRZ48_009637 [Zasmidium cellare]|uniref:AB hydrolase-1 domain-containing protein n=1 Tax=Zasmidium cellare TaxID=395010 RepID=A0ABR0EDA1_ZASCE|nr:hypothetical protein PRZ48_009637 [Zasmidium cellare]
MSSIPKTVVFVPGAWHNPQCFSLVAKQLRDAGYSTNLVTLPSVGASPFLEDFQPDVAKIRSAIQKAADQGHEVIVVVHSYGGVPSQEAIQGLDLHTRQKQGLSGGVAHIFFCCAFIVPPGQSLVSAFGGEHPPWYGFTEDRQGVFPLTPAETFYNDMPEDQVESAVAMLRHQSINCSLTVLKYAAWRDVPSTYLYCTKDQALPIEAQRMMVEELAGKQFGVTMRTETVEAGHSPFWSVPDEVTGAIRRAAGEEV